jgi:hypothetical protein
VRTGDRPPEAWHGLGTTEGKLLSSATFYNAANITFQAKENCLYFFISPVIKGMKSIICAGETR